MSQQESGLSQMHLALEKFDQYADFPPITTEQEEGIDMQIIGMHFVNHYDDQEDEHIIVDLE